MSPDVDNTSNTPSPTSRTETSNVPPPRSKTKIVSLFFLSKPYASEAAVGSFIILRTSKPAIFPASLVACLCESLKYAGTVITACFTVSPKCLLASSTNFLSTSAEISSDEKSFPNAGHSSFTLPLLSLTIYDTFFSSCDTSSERRPINLFTE